MKLSIDYKVVKSTPTLYAEECWRAGDGCGWQVRATCKLDFSTEFRIGKRSWRNKWLCNNCMVTGMSHTMNFRVGFQRWWSTSQAFPHCKPLVQIDGTWFYGKYTQILLIAVAQDGNRNVLPIAFAIVESENSESWAYFIQNLRRHVVRQDNICIISNRSNGLVAAIRQSEVPWRFVYCICHNVVNFHNQYKNKDWRKRIVNMGYELEAHRFKYKLARLETDMAGSNPSLRKWLGSMEPWQWAQCFDEGYQYSQITTNLVEAINSVLRRTRHFPISAIFSAIFYRLATLMPKMGLKQATQLEAGHVYVEKIRDAMKEKAQRARSMNAELYS
ncbi:uncharacterized protein LOC108477663 [Gossypium arboreum]|uniref:uncharacterized protein LOC108477663 n=1 Tax=Gossypium arboreum TaxID=29729 RepID=UPI0008192D45|nr:uncharacterized protein LOC108477663 [Gossypium arboreum]